MYVVEHNQPRFNLRVILQEQIPILTHLHVEEHLLMQLIVVAVQLETVEFVEQVDGADA